MDAQQRETLINEHVELVHYVVGRIAISLPPSVDREDLVSAGLIGLIKAVDRFDTSRGVKFETYASQVIRGEIMESLRARDWAPRSLRRRARELAEVVAELEAKIGQPPADAEIAQALDLSMNEYYELLGKISGTTIASLEEIVGDQSGREADQLGPVEPADDYYGNPLDNLEQNELRKMVAQVIEELPPREKHILALYYQEGLTLREIGEILGVTESRICQIHTQTISRLRGRLLRELG